MHNQCQHWSQTSAGGTPFDPADPVCRPTSHVAGLSPLSTDKLVSTPSQMKNSQVSISPTHCWKSFLPGAEVLNMCGMRWSADFVISISSLQKPTNLQWLNRDLMQVWIVILYNFHACAIGSMGRICSAVIKAQGGHTWYWFCDFNTGKSVLSNHQEYKECFL